MANRSMGFWSEEGQLSSGRGSQNGERERLGHDVPNHTYPSSLGRRRLRRGCTQETFNHPLATASAQLRFAIS
jgi:hypothetical protein